MCYACLAGGLMDPCQCVDAVRNGTFVGAPGGGVPVIPGEACAATNIIVNPGFETNPGLSFGTWNAWDAGLLSWKTTAVDNKIEIWRSNNGVPPDTGAYHAELNANFESTLYQDVATIVGKIYYITFAHRGR